MGNKEKGANAERELLKMFSENVWRAVRVAGSGLADDSPCDLIAGKAGQEKKILYRVQDKQEACKIYNKGTDK